MQCKKYKCKNMTDDDERKYRNLRKLHNKRTSVYPAEYDNGSAFYYFTKS